MSENKNYWNKRAKKDPSKSKATFYDVYLREKEIEEIMKYIEKIKPKSFLDVGCGNGYSVIKYAKKFPEIKFKGILLSSHIEDRVQPEDVSKDLVEKIANSGMTDKQIISDIETKFRTYKSRAIKYIQDKVS